MNTFTKMVVLATASFGFLATPAFAGPSVEGDCYRSDGCEESAPIKDVIIRGQCQRLNVADIGTSRNGVTVRLPFNRRGVRKGTGVKFVFFAVGKRDEAAPQVQFDTKRAVRGLRECPTTTGRRVVEISVRGVYDGRGSVVVSVPLETGVALKTRIGRRNLIGRWADNGVVTLVKDTKRIAPRLIAPAPAAPRYDDDLDAPAPLAAPQEYRRRAPTEGKSRYEASLDY